MQQQQGQPGVIGTGQTLSHHLGGGHASSLSSASYLSSAHQHQPAGTIGSSVLDQYSMQSTLQQQQAQAAAAQQQQQQQYHFANYGWFMDGFPSYQ